MPFLAVQRGIIVDAIFDSSERRLILDKDMNHHKLGCPNSSCGSRQVQLVAYINIIPAHWKCRRCKTKFKWEKGVYHDTEK